MRNVMRWLLAAGMVFAGIGHFSWGRREFRAQVPEWAARGPLDEDGVVLASGVVEVGMGAALALLPKHRRGLGTLLALFLVAVFPGNWTQFTHRRDGFGLDTDVKRLVRLFFQPVLIWAALWSTRR